MECNSMPAMEINRIVYACSGCADVGEVADQVSRKLRKDGFATPKASCLAGIGASIKPFIDAAQVADTVITIDGCDVLCAKKMLQNIGLEPQAIVLTEMGLEKGKTIPSSELIDRLCRLIIVREGLEAVDAPLLLMQGKPRQVVTANRKALELFGKELHEVEGHRGGQVFDCIYAFTEAGCGKDSNCEGCKIRDGIIDTFTTGTPHNGVSTALQIKKSAGTMIYELQVSTEKVGDLALVRIERFDRV